MPLDAEDEARVVELETFKAAMMDWIGARQNFDDRSYIAARIVARTPEPEEE